MNWARSTPLAFRLCLDVKLAASLLANERRGTYV